MPRPDGSSVPRRASCGPASVQHPEYIQLPHEVVPSSFNQAKPGSCWPFLMTSCDFGLGSLRSASALPLISFATSPSEGCLVSVYAQVRCNIVLGNVPPYV